MNEKLLIHFTSKYKYIKSIIESNSLRLSYCEEDFYMGKRKVSSSAHPMICFSEVEIKHLSYKNISYGRYGIGFTIDWARQNKINPVIYINQNSIAANGLASLLKARRNRQDSKLPDKLRLPIMQLKCFTKNEQGYNSHLQVENFNFKNESEWRFVPNKKDIGNGLISQNKSKYKANKDFYNNKLLPYPFKFNVEDIEVVYIEHETELNELKILYPLIESKIKISNWR